MDYTPDVIDYILDIFYHFDFNDMCEWEGAVSKYLSNFSPLDVSQEERDTKLSKILKYIQLLKEADLLSKLCDFYFYEAIDRDSWIKRFTYKKYLNMGIPGKPSTSVLEPYEINKCDDIIRYEMIKAIDRGELKVYPVGKISNEGKLIFFESKYIEKCNKEQMVFFKKFSITISKEPQIVYSTYVPLYETDSPTNPHSFIDKVYYRIKNAIRGIKNA